MPPFKTLAALALATALALPAHATTFASDQTDFWWATGESGAAINVSHQGDTVFITWYVYAPDGRPVWYSGSAPLSASGPQGLVFNGDLYETTGPWFGNPAYDPSKVVYRKVGTFSFNPRSVSDGALSYTVDGVPVTKVIERFTFRINQIGGIYYGSIAGTVGGCDAGNGVSLQAFPLQVTHGADNSVRMLLGSGEATCSIDGVYAQFGRLGYLSGTYACANGLNAVVTLTEIEANVSGLTARYEQVEGSCRLDGNLAAVRR